MLTKDDIKQGLIFRNTDTNEYFCITRVYDDHSFKYVGVIPSDEIESEDNPTETLHDIVDIDYITVTDEHYTRIFCDNH